MAMSALLPTTALHIYVTTTCFGDDRTEFPSSNLFAAAGDGIWDNEASCGRQYRARCISASQPGICVTDQTIQVKIVDYALTALSPSSAQSTPLYFPGRLSVESPTTLSTPSTLNSNSHFIFFTNK
ncbi:MYB transcription factor MYB82 [Hibiscus syriacus]|uniref:MYB transcription factor MYB82 n=1 Tax=Hibiscus syriacus TaxID=106335 RepID=A0A6A2WRN2_HIBSY|nr:MYB transcription factor MYB82 [Hibiscus syriacus]